ncbi:hypothetical protein MMC2321_01634 [Chitinophaga sp. MM2321]
MLLMGGTVLTTYAQRGYDRGHRGRGHDKHWDKWEHKHRGGRDYRRWDDDCYRPSRRVVYAPQPVYYPVVPVPVPVPVRVYAPARPRAVFHAGVTIVN